MHLTDNQAALRGLAGSNPALYTADAVVAPAAFFCTQLNRMSRSFMEFQLFP